MQLTSSRFPLVDTEQYVVAGELTGLEVRLEGKHSTGMIHKSMTSTIFFNVGRSILTALRKQGV
jgi:hypothetical protein